MISEKEASKLIKDLSSSDAETRNTAVLNFGNAGATAAQPLFDILANDPNPIVRENAAVALGKIGDEQGVTPLIGALRDADPGVRFAAAVALGKIGDIHDASQAAPPLINALKDSGSRADLRGASASALGKIGDPTAIGPLELALNDPDAGVRSAAQDALLKLITATYCGLGSKSKKADVTIKNTGSDLSCVDPSGLKQGTELEYWDVNKKQLASVGSWLNGKLNGHSISWTSNGRKAGEGDYKDGQQDGHWIEMYDDGQINLEADYSSGIYNGHYTEWFDNGQVSAKGDYRNGKKEGPWTKWYENGQLKFVGSYTDDRLDGHVTDYWPNGKKKGEGDYEDGEHTGH